MVSISREAARVQLTAVGASSGREIATQSLDLTGGGHHVHAPSMALARSSTCSSSWLPTFGAAPAAGTVRALEVFDDGTGPALYVAGDINYAGAVAVNNIARWDGSDWTPVGVGADDEISASPSSESGLFSSNSTEKSGVSGSKLRSSSSDSIALRVVLVVIMRVAGIGKSVCINITDFLRVPVFLRAEFREPWGFPLKLRKRGQVARW